MVGCREAWDLLKRKNESLIYLSAVDLKSIYTVILSFQQVKSILTVFSTGICTEGRQSISEPRQSLLPASPSRAACTVWRCPRTRAGCGRWGGCCGHQGSLAPYDRPATGPRNCPVEWTANHTQTNQPKCSAHSVSLFTYQYRLNWNLTIMLIITEELSISLNTSTHIT